MSRYKIIHSPFYYFTVFSLVLLLLFGGVLLYLLLISKSLESNFRENIQLVAEVSDLALQEDKARLIRHLESLEAVKTGSVQYVTKDQALRKMEREMGSAVLLPEMGNPFQDVITFRIKDAFLNRPMINGLEEKLTTDFPVNGLYYPSELFGGAQSVVRRASAVSTVLIVVMIFLVSVLVHHIMRLNVLSNRFTIRTMQLVGATRNFIVRPFLKEAVWMGMISAVIALLILALLVIFLLPMVRGLALSVQPAELTVVGVILILGALAICIISTYFAINKSVTRSYEELF